MKIQTKNFGEVEIADNKIITFDKGIIGFPELKHFTMLHDEEKGSSAGIRYLQSIEEPSFAMPVMDRCWSPRTTIPRWMMSCSPV